MAIDYRGEKFSGYNKPKRTRGHPKKSHAVLAKDGDKVKLIRFGQQGVSGSPKKTPMDSINLPIATVVIILIQLGGGIWFGSNISSRVSAVENRLESSEILPVGSAGKISEMSDRLARIETKLELLMEFNK